MTNTRSKGEKNMGKYVAENLEALEYQYKICLLAYQDGIVDQKTAFDALKRYCRALRKNDITCYDDYKIIYDNKMLKEFKFYVKKHRKLWSNVVKYMCKTKYDKYCLYIPDIKKIVLGEQKSYQNCFLCSYALKQVGNPRELICKKCPFKLNGNSCLDGLYDDLCLSWNSIDEEVDLKSREKAIKIAEQIRDIPCENYWWRKNK